MTFAKLRAAAVMLAPAVIFLAALAGIALYTLDARPNRPSVGELRGLMLEEMTAGYVSRYPETAAQIAATDQLAPLPYLNTQLNEREMRWRVRLVDGSVEYYIVS